MISARFAVTRGPAVAPNAMVATSSSLGTAAALETFGRGGNAVDAAIAADAVLGVVQPMRSGLGGDLFALVEHDGDVVGYNGSGALPAGFVLDDGPMPARGGATASVPGIVEAWGELLRGFGRLDLATCLEPAIRVARNGFPVGIEEAAEWGAEARRLTDEVHEMILPGGRAPVAGQVLANVGAGARARDDRDRRRALLLRGLARRRDRARGERPRECAHGRRSRRPSG